jgi:hypothetical protein
VDLAFDEKPDVRVQAKIRAGHRGARLTDFPVRFAALVARFFAGRVFFAM